ncbi:gfo/Idh/MocA family oxidoreductase, partial [Candidatus Woesearchaeota archaeon]
MKRKLRVGVIGVGSFGKNHVRVYSDLENVDLVAVCDRNQEALQRVRKYGAREYTSYREMLKREQLDLVSLVVPTKLHHAIGLDVLNSGVNLLVEKPIAATVEEARELIE